MPRGYHQDSDVKYGRPKTKIAREPPRFFRTYDEEMKGWDVRQFLRELVNRQAKHDWEQQHWRDQPPHIPETLIPITDPDEINKFVCRPPAVSQISSNEDAIHALTLGLILIAVDPNTPNLREKLNIEAKKIRAKHPLPIKKKRGVQVTRPMSPALTRTS